MRELIQIVARTPPSIDGVGDYAWRLGEKLLSEHSVRSHYLVCDPLQPHGAQNGFVRTVIGAHTPESLRQGLDEASGAASTPMLLHYVGYGFDRNGVPEWLLRGLENELIRRNERCLTTVFHELYATAPPWRRGFWYSGRQKRIAMRLQQLSARSLCTIQRNERELREWLPRQAIERLAVPSTVGEPAEGSLPEWSSRRNTLVVFGLGHSRQRAYANPAAMDALCRRYSIEEIVDIGPALSVVPKLAHARWTPCGPLEPADVARQLSRSRYGYLYYPAEYLAKSSIYAAYSACGVATFLPVAGAGQPDGLVASVHYASAVDPPSDSAQLGRIAAAATQWYAGHRISAHAAWAARVADAEELEMQVS